MKTQTSSSPSNSKVMGLAPTLPSTGWRKVVSTVIPRWWSTGSALPWLLALRTFWSEPSAPRVKAFSALLNGKKLPTEPLSSVRRPAGAS